VNIIPTMAPRSVTQGRPRQQIQRNPEAQEKRSHVPDQDRRKTRDRRQAQQKIPIELRSGTDRRQTNRLSITT
jgi:hypothetical protein